MELHQIHKKLARIQLALDGLAQYLRQPVRMDHSACPACRQPTFRNLKLLLPGDDLATVEPELVGQTPIMAVRLFHILDGHCPACQFDWWNMQSRIEPELGIDRALSVHPPRMRNDELCPECLKLRLRGLFRSGTCTGGYCIDCQSLIAPASVAHRFRRTRERILVLKSKLEQETNILLEIAADMSNPDVVWIDGSDLDDL